MKREIPLSVPNLDLEILDNLKECIETGWVSTGGRFITEFEKKTAHYVNTPDAVSCQSGTAGLHVALKILGVEPDDEVIVPTLTFIAAVNPVAYIGAHPVFMDCDDYFCIDPAKLEKFCTEECELRKCENGKALYNKTTGRKVSAVVVVHVFGNLADMERIMQITEKYNLKVLEDATEALGSRYTSGTYCGRFSGTVGDMGVYSFNANKIITTGGGGMIVSNNQEYLDKARYLTITAKGTSPDEALHFVHDEVGYNYRMLNIQAAFGVSQIDKLEDFIKTKQENYKLYCKLLNGVSGLSMLPYTNDIRSNHWFYALYIDAEKFGETRDELMHRLIGCGVQCRPVWKLTHMQTPYCSAQAYEIKNAYRLHANVLNIPCSTNLTADDVKYICEMILNNTASHA